MTISRRQFLSGAVSLAGVAAASSTTLAFAKPVIPKTVDVVKIMSFACPVCRASEVHDRLIEAAARKTGGRLVRGPMPSIASETGAKEQVYYASRSLSFELSERLVELFYKGQQDLSIPLDNLTQVYVYLQQQLTDMPEARFNELFSKAQQPQARDSLTRAVQLAYSMGVEAIPSYILVVGNKPVAAHAPNTIGSSSLTALRDEVIQSISNF